MFKISIEPGGHVKPVQFSIYEVHILAALMPLFLCVFGFDPNYEIEY